MLIRLAQLACSLAVPPAKPKTWILTGSLENFRAGRERDFRVVGMKERRRRLAEQVTLGDCIAFYVTGVQAFGAITRVVGPLYEDRTRIWPGKPGQADPYPWRFETEPVIVLDERDFVPAEAVAGELEHARKWPAEHWRLAFQGQLRSVCERDAVLLERVVREAAPGRRSGVNAGATEPVQVLIGEQSAP